jgi:hypothetical protein
MIWTTEDPSPERSPLLIRKANQCIGASQARDKFADAPSGLQLTSQDVRESSVSCLLI